jgi:hypothetical protein
LKVNPKGVQDPPEKMNVGLALVVLPSSFSFFLPSPSFSYFSVSSLDGRGLMLQDVELFFAFFSL